jgi:transcriptional regulator with XRE-family HTH domain
MGELVEKAIRKKGLTITEIAVSMEVSRRTVYNWFKEEVINVTVLNKLSRILAYDFSSSNSNIQQVTAYISSPTEQQLATQDDAYWQDQYIALLERYSELLTAIIKKENKPD